MKPKTKILTSNSFTITKRETRSMKREATKTKDTLNNRTSTIANYKTINASKQYEPLTIAKISSHSKNPQTNNDNEMESDDVMDSLKCHSNSDDVIFNNNDDLNFFSDIDPSRNNRSNRIIPSLKTQLATDY